jgi:hypothetical protein
MIDLRTLALGLGAIVVAAAITAARRGYEQVFQSPLDPVAEFVLAAASLGGAGIAVLTIGTAFIGALELFVLRLLRFVRRVRASSGPRKPRPEGGRPQGGPP